MLAQRLSIPSGLSIHLICNSDPSQLGKGHVPFSSTQSKIGVHTCRFQSFQPVQRLKMDMLYTDWF